MKLSLWLLAVVAVLGGLAAWNFWRTLEIGDDRSSFNFALVFTGACGLGWFGLLIYLFTLRPAKPADYQKKRKARNVPWWPIAMGFFVLLLVAGGIVLNNLSHQLLGEFVLLREGQLDALVERIQSDPKLLVKTEGKEGETLVQVAFRENMPQAVDRLIRLGASKNDLGGAGRDPVAVSLANLPMLLVLLENGIDPNAPASDGTPPIHPAVEHRLEGAVKALLDAGAGVDARDLTYRTPLMRAAEADALPIVRLLLAAGADVNAFDRRGDTPLHYAVRKRSLEGTRLLLDGGADPRKFNFIHLTPLHLAVSGGHIELVELFLEIPGMTGLHDDQDLTPLDYALRGGHYDIADRLIDAGADVNRILANGDTLMHRMILARNYRTTRFLINAGGDVGIPNASGETAHDLLRRKQLAGLLEMVQRRDHPEAFTNAVDSASIDSVSE
ncbi:ankyrin repeat domain-containing protein [Pontiella sp.]|uniref:ankyrin repeat domain-containing protein n=1 Tax=Pontiella sp. TaxID=2837462 RepID=UPI0035671702